MNNKNDKEKEQELFEFMVNAKLSYHLINGDSVIEPFDFIDLDEENIERLETLIPNWSWDFRPCELEYIVNSILDKIIGDDDNNNITCENIKWIDEECNDTKSGLPDRVVVMRDKVFPDGLTLDREGCIKGNDVDKIAKYLHNRFGAFPVSIDTRVG